METTYARSEEGSPRRTSSPEARAAMAVLKARKEERRGEEMTEEQFNSTAGKNSWRALEHFRQEVGRNFLEHNARLDAQRQKAKGDEDAELEAA